MRLEASGMGYKVPGVGDQVPGLSRVAVARQCPSPTMPSPSPMRLLQAKNMDYYKREVSGTRDGGSSWEARAARHPNISPALAPDRVLQEGHGQDQGEILHLP